MPSGEVDTNELVDNVLKAGMCPSTLRTIDLIMTNVHAGKALYVPKVVHPNVSASSQPEMHMLRIYDSDDLHSIKPGVWDIREPDWDWTEGKRASGPHLLPPPTLPTN